MLQRVALLLAVAMLAEVDAQAGIFFNRRGCSSCGEYSVEKAPTAAAAPAAASQVAATPGAAAIPPPPPPENPVPPPPPPEATPLVAQPPVARAIPTTLGSERAIPVNGPLILGRRFR